MMTERLGPLDADAGTLIDPNGAIGRAAALLAGGELVAFPTETVYGLGADARNEAAVAKIFAVKEARPTTR
ncbi:MAG: Sua5/YciO/YrdC/YwlC family protein [Dehalococcoidia bacterium]